MRRRIFSGDHLRVGVRLTTMQPAHLLAGRRIDPKIVFKRSVGIAHQSLRNHHPRIVVAEDAGVLFVARRIRGDLAKVEIIFRVCRLLKHDAVWRRQNLAD